MKNKNKKILRLGILIVLASVFVSAILVGRKNIESPRAYVPTIDRTCNETGATGDCSEAHHECDIKSNGPHHCQWSSSGFTWVNNHSIRCAGTCVNGNGDTPTPTPTLTPSPTPTPTLIPTPTPTPTQTPTVTPTPTNPPNFCNGTCGSNYNCQGGYFCYNGYCRNPACPVDSTCGCATAPPVLGATAPPVLPKTGSSDIEIIIGLLGVMGTGFWIFKRFKII